MYVPHGMLNKMHLTKNDNHHSKDDPSYNPYITERD